MQIIRALALASSLTGLVVLVACSSDDKKSGDVTCDNPTGGVVPASTPDNHCGGSRTPILESACSTKPDGGMTIQSVLLHHTDAAHDEDGGTDPGYGPTLNGNESDDDDCKYHVRWEAETKSSVCVNGDIYFKVSLITTADGAPVRGVPIRVEAVLNHDHVPPPTDQKSVEIAGSPGSYRVGPVKLDRSGNWMVRFHIREECGDAENSPHGHAAYFVAVP